MRKSWILVSVAIVLVGYAGYRLGRRNVVHEESPLAEGGSAGAATAADSAAPSDATPSPAGTRQAGANASVTPGASRPSSSASPAEGKESFGSHGPSRPYETTNLGVLNPARSLGAESATGSRIAAPGMPPAAGSVPALSGTAPPGAPQSGNPATPPPHPYQEPPLATPAPSPAARTDPSPSPSPSDDPGSDRKPPVLQYLRFDPPQVQDGGVSTLTIGATDDLSGVKSVFGTLRSPSETAVIPFVGQDAGGTGVFTISITIPKKGETGDWFVGSLQILDKADNPLYLAYTKATVPPGGALRVNSADSDSTPPVVRGAVLDKRTVAGGEKNRIVVDVEDDDSGVASVTGTFQNPSKSAFIPFSSVGGPNGPWAGDVPVPMNADCAEWSLRQIRAVDKANNAVVVMGDSPELGHVSFFVASGGGCDAEPPVLDALLVAPNEVSNQSASTIVLTISAHDDGSGLASATGRVEGPPSANGQAPRIYFSALPDPKNPDVPMTAKVVVKQFAASGVWRVTVVELTDKARNTRIYTRSDSILANAFVNVD